MRCRIVKKFQHQWMPFQSLLHDAALYSDPAAVDKPHFVQAGSVSLGQVLFDYRRNVTGREGVKVEQPVDRNPKRVLILHVRAGRVLRSRRSLRS